MDFAIQNILNLFYQEANIYTNTISQNKQKPLIFNNLISP